MDACATGTTWSAEDRYWTEDQRPRPRGPAKLI
jgi:hypothetical protein